jgi:hypothetical protein
LFYSFETSLKYFQKDGLNGYSRMKAERKVSVLTTETEQKQNHSLNYKSLIKTTCENGDLVILGLKGTCKTTLLMHLARTLRAEPNNHVIVFETFPKWIHEFDQIPFMAIADSEVQCCEDMPYLEEDRAYILRISKS